jgi:hypothetical protein
MVADSAKRSISNYNLVTYLSPPARKLEWFYAVRVGSMKNLVGRCFSLADGHYRIVDVRQLGGDAMVYAEPVASGGVASEVQAARPAGRAVPNRAAFHFADIAAILDAPRSA